MSGARIDLDALRARTEQTENFWLPVPTVMALVEAVEAAQAVASHSPFVVDSGAHDRLRAALAVFDTGPHT